MKPPAVLFALAMLTAMMISPVASLSEPDDPVSEMEAKVIHMLKERGEEVPETVLVNGESMPFEDAVQLLQPFPESASASLPATHDAGFAMRGTQIGCRTAAWVQSFSFSGSEPFENVEFTEVPEAPSGTVNGCRHEYATGTVTAEVNPDLDPEQGDTWVACLDAGQGGPSNPYWFWAVGTAPCHRDDFASFSMTGMVGLLRLEIGDILIAEQWHGGVDYQNPDPTQNGAAVTLAD